MRTLNRLEKGKQGFETWFEFIDKHPSILILTNECQEHFQTCEEGELKIFPFFKLNLRNKYLREQYENYFQDKFKPMLHY